MLLNNPYRLVESSNFFSVVWMSVPMTQELKFLAISLLILLPLIFIFRSRVALQMNRYFHLPLTGQQIGLGAPLLSVLCALVLFFDRPPHVVLQWVLEPTRLWVKSESGSVSIPWENVRDVQWEGPVSRKDKAVLTFRSKQGPTLRLNFHWLLSEDQDRVFKELERRSGGSFVLPPLPSEEPPDASRAQR